MTPTFLGVSKQGDKIKKGYITLAFLGPRYETPVFSAVPGEGTGDTIRIGDTNSAFSRAQYGVEFLRNPCVLGGLRTMGHN